MRANIQLALGVALCACGFYIYGYWEQMGLSCPCTGSACIVAGCACILTRRMWKRALPQEADESVEADGSPD